jgi:hypothetical protein
MKTQIRATGAIKRKPNGLIKWDRSEGSIIQHGLSQFGNWYQLARSTIKIAGNQILFWTLSDHQLGGKYHFPTLREGKHFAQLLDAAVSHTI